MAAEISSPCVSPGDAEEEARFRAQLRQFEAGVQEHQARVQSECARLRLQLRQFDTDKKQVDYAIYAACSTRRASSIDMQAIKHAQLVSQAKLNK